MVVFRYTKKDGAEYLSHLDMLRHLNKIIRRAGIGITYAKGFNRHMHIYMSSPIAVGVKSEAEYCLAVSDEDAADFKEKFNNAAPRGVCCLSAANTEKKINVAGVIDRALYEISGITPFDAGDILNAGSFEITDKRGNTKDVRDRIFDLSFKDGKLCALLGFGNDALRPDLFALKLSLLYGGKTGEIMKKEVFVKDLTFDRYLEGFKG